MRSKRRGKIKALLIALIILIFLLLTVIILYNKSISGNVVLNLKYLKTVQMKV